MDKGFIYKIISPNNKAYIGQVREYLTNGTIKGISGRWKSHINSSKSKGGCRYLNNAIRKYGHENFKIFMLIKCGIEELDFYEKKFIKEHNTLAPNGYNLQTGGTNSTIRAIETFINTSGNIQTIDDK